MGLPEEGGQGRHVQVGALEDGVAVPAALKADEPLGGCGGPQEPLGVPDGDQGVTLDVRDVDGDADAGGPGSAPGF